MRGKPNSQSSTTGTGSASSGWAYRGASAKPGPAASTAKPASGPASSTSSAKASTGAGAKDPNWRKAAAKKAWETMRAKKSGKASDAGFNEGLDFLRRLRGALANGGSDAAKQELKNILDTHKMYPADAKRLKRWVEQLIANGR